MQARGRVTALSGLRNPGFIGSYSSVQCFFSPTSSSLVTNEVPIFRFQRIYSTEGDGSQPTSIHELLKQLKDMREKEKDVLQTRKEDEEEEEEGEEEEERYRLRIGDEEEEEEEDFEPPELDDETRATFEAALRLTNQRENGEELSRDDMKLILRNLQKGDLQKEQDAELRKKQGAGAVAAPKLRLEDLKYFYLFNKKMRRWIIDSKTPRGYFNAMGRWETRKAYPTYDELIKGTDLDDSIARLQDFEKRKTIPLPKDLRGVYRFGITEEELQEVGASDKIRELLSFRHAFRKERNQERIRQAIEKWGRHIGDTGSSEVQIAGLTVKIRSMNEYLKNNHKNHAYKRHMQIMIDRRRKLLRYLKKQNVETYYKLLLDLGLRDVVQIRINRKAYK